MLHGADKRSPPCVDDIVLAALIDGRLPAAERAEVEAHLATCPDCSAVSSDVMRTVAEARRRERLRHTAWVALTAVALAGLVGALLFLWG